MGKDKRFSYLENTIFNYIGILALALITFLGTPMLVAGLGKDNFAIYRIATSTIINYMALLDLGVGIAIKRKLGIALHTGNELQARQILGAGFMFYLLLGIIIAIISLMLLLWFPRFLGIKESMILPFRCLIICVCVYVFMYLMSSLPNAVFIAKSRYDILQISTIISSSTLYFGAVLLYPLFEQKLWANCISCLLSQIFAFSISLYFAKHIWTGYGMRINIKDVSLIRSMLSFGFWGIIIILVPISIIQSQPIIIMKVLDLDITAKYSVIIILYTQLTTLVGASASSIFATALEKKSKGVRELSILYKDVLGRATFFWSIIVFPLFYYAKDFLTFWINPDFSSVSQAFRILLFTSFFAPISITTNYMLNAVGKIRPLAIIAIFTLIIFILLNILVLKFSRPDLILFLLILLLAYSVRGMMSGIQACKQLEIPLKELLFLLIKLPIPFTIIFPIGYILDLVFTPKNLFEILLVLAISSVLCAVFCFFIFISKSDRELSFRKLKELIAHS